MYITRKKRKSLKNLRTCEENLKKNETSELVREKLNENLYRIWKNLMKPIFWRKNE